jgi:hypothetical protein
MALLRACLMVDLNAFFILGAPPVPTFEIHFQHPDSMNKNFRIHFPQRIIQFLQAVSRPAEICGT